MPIVPRLGRAIRLAFAAAGWVLALCIIVLSVVPPADRPTTGTSSNFEHIAIYLLTGFAFAVGYRDRRRELIAALALFSGLVECLQLWVPGRHARLSDFVIDVASAWAGVAAAFIAEKLIGRK